MRLSHIQGRMEQQMTLSRLIAISGDNFSKLSIEDITPRLVSARVTSLTNNWDKFSVIHDAVMMALNQLNSNDQSLIQEHSYLSDNVYSVTYELLSGKP